MDASFNEPTEIWMEEVRGKITRGMDSIRAGRTIPVEQVKAEMAVFKRKARGTAVRRRS